MFVIIVGGSLRDALNFTIMNIICPKVGIIFLMALEETAIASVARSIKQNGRKTDLINLSVYRSLIISTTFFRLSRGVSHNAQCQYSYLACNSSEYRHFRYSRIVFEVCASSFCPITRSDSVANKHTSNRRYRAARPSSTCIHTTSLQ